jgi:hypothetical protein
MRESRFHKLLVSLSNLRLTSKLQLAFVLIGLFSIGITGWQAFEIARNAIEVLTFERLTSVRETKKRQVESHFGQIEHQITSFSEDRTIVEGLERLILAYGNVPEANRHAFRIAVPEGALLVIWREDIHLTWN